MNTKALFNKGNLYREYLSLGKACMTAQASLVKSIHLLVEYENSLNSAKV